MARANRARAVQTSLTVIEGSFERPGLRASTDELVRSLGELGLTQNEGRVYLALLILDRPTAAETAREAGVPRPKVYEALGSLEAKGFCSSAGGTVTRYRADAPATTLQAWLRHRQHERMAAADREQTIAENLIGLLPVPGSQPAGGAPDFIEAITGRARTSEALEQLISKAERSISMMTQPPFLQPRPRWNVAEIAALRRGVDVRIIYTPAVLSDRNRWVDLVEAGGNAAVLDELPMKLLVCDNAAALISLRDAATGEQSATTAHVRHPDLAHSLALLFEEQWQSARALSAQDYDTA